MIPSGVRNGKGFDEPDQLRVETMRWRHLLCLGGGHVSAAASGCLLERDWRATNTDHPTRRMKGGHGLYRRVRPRPIKTNRSEHRGSGAKGVMVRKPRMRTDFGRSGLVI